MDKTIFKSKNVLNEQNIKFTLFYWLLSRDIIDCENNISTVYGIEVTKYRDSYLEESDRIECISCDKSDVCELISLIANANVTPTTLVNVVDDYISCRSMVV